MVCPDSLTLLTLSPCCEKVQYRYRWRRCHQEDCCPRLLTLAFFSQDGRVFIWTCDDASGNTWSPKLLHKFNDVVWHVSWSITANILAVSGGDNKVSSVAQSRVQLFATPWTTAYQASVSITNAGSPPKPMSIESVMPSNHLILCHPLLFLPSIFPSIEVFSNESAVRIRWPKYWSFNFSISPSNEYSGLISFRIDWLDILAAQGQ